MYDVITVGSSTIDVFALADSELIKIKTPYHEEELIAYPLGSKLLIKNLDFLTGGGGVNTAISFSRLGFKVAYLGMTGQDTNSELIKQKLKKEKVTFLGKGSKTHRSGYSIILDSIDGDRTILAYKGANNYLKYNEINLKKLKTKWFYFSSMVEESFKTLERLADFAVKNKIKIAFNPSNYLAKKGINYLNNILSKTNILILNKEEACLLVGDKNISQMIVALIKLCPKKVVITDGKNGAYTIDNSQLLHIHAHGIKSLEPTGAGDAFASTYVAGLIKRKALVECLKLAALNAGSVIQIRGANEGLLSYSVLRRRLKKSPKVETKSI